MREYNPLSVDELGRNAARALMEHPAAELPPAESFGGSGVYTIHYPEVLGGSSLPERPQPLRRLTFCVLGSS